MTRALIVCAAVQSGGHDLVAALAHHFDVVIGVDGGGTVCLEAGVVPTMLVGDFDSIETESLDEAAARGVPLRSYPPDKDRTDLVLAIGEARALGVTEITVTAATSARLDHTLGALAALVEAVDLAPRIVEPDLNGWLLCAHGRASVRVRGIRATVSIVPFTPTVRLSAGGFRWPLEHADILHTDTVGISNVVLEDGAFVTVEAGGAYVLSPRTHVPPAEESPVSPTGTDGVY